jgi:hypothetical protein
MTETTTETDFASLEKVIRVMKTRKIAAREIELVKVIAGAQAEMRTLGAQRRRLESR